MLEDPCERSGRMPTGRVRRRDDPECCARLLALSSLYLITAARKSGSSPSLTTTAPPGQNGNDQPAHGEDLAHRPCRVRILPSPTEGLPVFRDLGPILGRDIGGESVGPEDDLSRRQAKHREKSGPEYPGLPPRHDNDRQHRDELEGQQIGELPPASVRLLNHEIFLTRQINLVRQLEQMGERSAQGQARRKQGDEERNIISGRARFWPAAEKADLPVMFLTSGQTSLFAGIAERHPQLALILDHMGVGAGLRPHRDLANSLVPEAISQSAALAKYPNVSVKLSSVPLVSTEPYPFRDTIPHIRRLFDSYGPQRCHWGTDVTNSLARATYRQRMTQFTEELTFLSDDDKDWIMGRSILARLKWASGGAPASLRAHKAAAKLDTHSADAFKQSMLA